MFTIPALIFLGFGKEFTFWRIFPLALLGGWLGVLFMVPIRRQLIVKEHGNLSFPEGTACADVLVAGERGRFFRRPRLLGARPRRHLYILNENLPCLDRTARRPA